MAWIRLFASGLFTLTTLAMLLGAAGGGAADPPPVFSSLTLDQAKASAAAATPAKLVLVMGTASWCKPCKQMELTAWRDPKVVQWVKDNAVAIQVDVDRHPAAAKELAITAMPTLVLLRDGREVSRTSGGMSGDSLVQWLSDTAGAAAWLEEASAKEGAAKTSTGEKTSLARLESRYNRGSDLLMRGKHEAAVKEFLWVLREGMSAPEARDERVPSLAGGINSAVQKDDNARTLVITERDLLSRRVNTGDKNAGVVEAWAMLNQALDDELTTLDWYDANKKDPAAAESVKLIVRECGVQRLLFQQDRWAEAGSLYGKVENELWIAERSFDMGQKYTERPVEPPSHMGMPEEARKHFQQLMKPGDYKQQFRERTAKMYAALMAASRDDDVNVVLRRAFKTLDDAEMRQLFVAMALKADQPRREHIEWLDRANAPQELKDELAEALKARE